MAKNVWLTPEQPMYVQGCKVIKILAIPTQEMLDAEYERKSELGKAKRRPVRHLGTNIIYKSIKEAAIAVGASESSISRVCNGNQQTTQGHKFCYVKE